MDLFISQHDILPLLLERKQLLDSIQVNGNARTERHTEQQEHRPYLVLNAEMISPMCDPSVHGRRPLLFSTVLRDCGYLNLRVRREKCQGRVTQFVMSRTVLPVIENEKPQPGLTPDWGFSVMLSLLPPTGPTSLSRDRYPDYSFKVNHVES